MVMSYYEESITMHGFVEGVIESPLYHGVLRG